MLKFLCFVDFDFIIKGSLVLMLDKNLMCENALIWCIPSNLYEECYLNNYFSDNLWDNKNIQRVCLFQVIFEDSRE